MQNSFFSNVNIPYENVFCVQLYEEIESAICDLVLENKEPPQINVAFRGSRTIRFDINYKNKKYAYFEIHVFDPLKNTTSFLEKSSDLSCYIDEKKGLLPGGEYRFKCRCKLNNRKNIYTDWSNDLRVKMQVGMFFCFCK